MTFRFEGKTYQVDGSVQREVTEALGAAHVVSDKWLKIEPSITSAFTPKAYEAGTEARKALIAYLQVSHPKAGELNKLAREVAQSDSIEKRAALHVLRLQVNNSVNNALRLLAGYYKTGRDGGRAPRRKKGLKDLILTFVDRLENYKAKDEEKELYSEVLAFLKASVKPKKAIVPPAKVTRKTKEAVTA